MAASQRGETRCESPAVAATDGLGQELREGLGIPPQVVCKQHHGGPCSRLAASIAIDAACLSRTAQAVCTARSLPLIELAVPSQQSTSTRRRSDQLHHALAHLIPRLPSALVSQHNPQTYLEEVWPASLGHLEGHGWCWWWVFWWTLTNVDNFVQESSGARVRVEYASLNFHEHRKIPRGRVPLAALWVRVGIAWMSRAVLLRKP